MDYKTHEEITNLHLIKTDKFKTILFKIVFTSKFNKDEITKRNLLVDNLCLSSKKYPSRREMNIIKQDLYGLDLYASSKRVGNYFVTEFNLSMLNPKYTEDEMLYLSFDFFHNILFNPNIDNNKFNEELFNLTKEYMKDEIKSIKENPNIYSNIKLRSLLGDYPFSYHMEGYLSDLEKETPSSIYDYYKEFLTNNNVDMYLIGNCNDKYIDIIKDKFIFNNQNRSINDFFIEYKNTKNKINEVKEESKFKQSHLSISCSLDNLTLKEKIYTVVLYNIILGNGPESKFFKNIREKYSYAYTISSSYRRADNILVINAGISLKNYDNVLIGIKEELDNMRKGYFSSNDLENAKKIYISVINDISEYASSISEYYYNMKYLKLKTIDEEIDIINSITKEEVILLAKKINIDTIFLLKEDEYEEN